MLSALDASNMGSKPITFTNETMRDQVASLVSKGVKMVAFDFEMVIFRVRIYQGIAYDVSPHESTQYVSRMFLAICPLLIEAGIRVAVTTFSDDDEMDGISGSLLVKTLMKTCFQSREIWSKIIVIAGNPEEHCEIEEAKGSSCEACECFCLALQDPHISDGSGKEWHLIQAMKAHTRRTGVTLERTNVVLIDISGQEVEIARALGFRAWKLPSGRRTSQESDVLPDGIDEGTWEAFVSQLK